jgi:glycosyltransferase involved in cell wall biosynthesis
MAAKHIVISINAAWNIVNFRLGLVRALQQAGFKVTALAPSDSYRQSLEQMGVEFHDLPMDSGGVSPARDLVLLFRYVRALRRLRPGCYLGYTAKPNIYGSIAAQLLGIPVINNISGLGTAFIRSGLLTKMVSALYRVALRRSATVFFQNADDRDLFVSKGLLRDGQAELVPGSGIDLDRFQPAAWSGGNDRPTFLMIGRMLRDKGVLEFVEAARIVRVRHPGTRFQILGFIGVPNRTAIGRPQVEAWAADGLIEYLGDTDDVRPFITEADCIVLPSYREGLPRTLLEGAAMAKPLVATDVPGCREVVKEGESGFLCAPRDPHSLADAMMKIINLSPQERLNMGAAGRALVEETFSESVVIDRYLAAITRAIGTSPPKDAAPGPRAAPSS